MDILTARLGLPLNGAVASNDPQQVADAARQLETQFARMLVSSMRTTSLGDSMFPGSAGHFRDMYDQQLAGALTRGKGLGLQEMIQRQLGGPAKSLSDQFERASVMYPMDGYKRLLPAMKAIAPAAVTGLPLPTGTPQPAPPLPVGVPVARGVAPTTVAPAVTAHVPATPARAAQAAHASPCDGTPAVNPKPNTPEAFVAEIWPHAQKAAAELGVCPKVLVAQAALETGWGRHTIKSRGGDAHNLFGIKAGAGWRGESTVQSTREVIAGAEVRENAAFRAYHSIADSFSDYVSLLKNSPRYAAAIGQSTGRAFASALQSAGYATDPQYAAKLTAIAEGPTLNRALARIDGPAA